jgi:hypothetical protein
MAGGLGFVRDAQKSFEKNRQLFKSKGAFQRNKDNATGDAANLKFKEATAEEIAQFRAEFLKNKRLENIRAGIISAVVIAAIAVAIWLIL